MYHAKAEVGADAVQQEEAALYWYQACEKSAAQVMAVKASLGLDIFSRSSNLLHNKGVPK